MGSDHLFYCPGSPMTLLSSLYQFFQINYIIEKIEKQIEHYRARINKAKHRLDELRNLRQAGKATIYDEEELIELDNFLEKALDRTSAIPSDLKQVSSSKKLGSLLAKANEILECIKEG